MKAYPLIQKLLKQVCEVTRDYAKHLKKYTQEIIELCIAVADSKEVPDSMLHVLRLPLLECRQYSVEILTNLAE
ncbi:hypothetical protein OFN63_32400, partial [Escherichia coli]|nr:hypothetical protein [Escherichia coli]